MTHRRMGPDYPVSRFWAQEVGATDKECYSNALDTLFALPPVLLEQAWYCEGWAISMGLLMQHGWIELDDGRIIDPTPAWLRDDEGDNPRPYFAGRRYRLSDVCRRIHVEGAASLPLDDALACECVPPDCVELYGEAFTEAYGLAAWQLVKAANPHTQEAHT